MAAPQRKFSGEIPPILLEGDAPSALPGDSGPGKRFILSPVPPAQQVKQAEASLPESYGTERLFLAAQDPHCLFTSWDMAREQLQKHQEASLSGRISLRLYENEFKGRLISELVLLPDASSSFLTVDQSGTSFVAELGYITRDGQWHQIAVSSPVSTPRETMSKDKQAEFLTIPPDVEIQQIVELTPTPEPPPPAEQPLTPKPELPLKERIKPPKQQDFVELIREVQHEPAPVQPPTETPAPLQFTRTTPEFIHETVRAEPARIERPQMDVAEWIAQSFQQPVSSPGAEGFGPPEAAPIISSPFGPGEEAGEGFWFNVNAELVIYGATEPDAKVTLAGRPVQLRPDGTFSFRFALPDGSFRLPVTARSARGEQGRTADLTFSRKSAFLGEVGLERQPPDLVAVSEMAAP